MTDDELAVVDPVVMNLLVAKAIPEETELDVDRYVHIVDGWAAAIRERIDEHRHLFDEMPLLWLGDENLFRMGVLGQYLFEDLGINYPADERKLQWIAYSKPSQLFLHGVIDGRKGNCANMSVLMYCLGRRIGLDISLACAWTHVICRLRVAGRESNIEPTSFAAGHGVYLNNDAYYRRSFPISNVAAASNSELRSLTPSEMLGLFIGFRGRFYEDILQREPAEVDYLQARALFPTCRNMYMLQMQTSIRTSVRLFEMQEKGSLLEQLFFHWQLARNQYPQFTNPNPPCDPRVIPHRTARTDVKCSSPPTHRPAPTPPTVGSR